jgi:D-alanyl-D-alanine dipeptidase
MAAAIDLTLVDASSAELDMGTAFDDFSAQAFHGDLSISSVAQRNRAVLLGLMTSAGWDFFRNEWWHYQLFSPRETYPVLDDSVLPISMMR